MNGFDDMKEYQKLLDSLQKRSELLDVRQEELDSSFAILKQIVHRIYSANKQEEHNTPSLPRTEETHHQKSMDLNRTNVCSTAEVESEKMNPDDLEEYQVLLASLQADIGLLDKVQEELDIFCGLLRYIVHKSNIPNKEETGSNPGDISPASLLFDIAALSPHAYAAVRNIVSQQTQEQDYTIWGRVNLLRGFLKEMKNSYARYTREEK